MVETALVLPLMLMFLLAIMEFGRYVLCLQIVTNAAREGCRYAVTHTQPETLNGATTGATTTDVTNVITNFLAGQQLSGETITIYGLDGQGNKLGSWNSATPGQYVGVGIQATFQLTVPKLLSLPTSIPVSGQSLMLCEGN